MKREYHRIIPAVYTILEKNNSVLLLVRKNTGYRDGQLNVPSGHVEKGETPTIAAIRETLEEVGIKVAEKDVRHAFTLFRKTEGEDERVDMFFKMKSDLEPMNAEPNKCEKLVWADMNNLPENTFDYLKYVFMKMKSGEVYGEWGYES